MSAKQRTSLSLSAEALAAAQARREALGYATLSEYVEFLILEDARQKRRHLLTRDGGGVHYEAVPDDSNEGIAEKPGHIPAAEDEPSFFPKPSDDSPSPFSPSDVPPASPGDSFPRVVGSVGA